MLLRTVVTNYIHTSHKTNIEAEMLRRNLAQNVDKVNTPCLIGDWVDPEQLGMTHKTYLERILALESELDCVAHVELVHS